MCKESNEDVTKKTLQNKQTEGIHESSVGVLVRVHMLQVCVHVKHVCCASCTAYSCHHFSHRQCSHVFVFHLYVNSL